MKIYIENTDKFLYGYQLHVVDPERNHDQVIDFRAYTVREITKMARKTLKMYNDKFGTDYQIEDVLADGREGQAAAEMSHQKRGLFHRIKNLLPSPRRMVR